MHANPLALLLLVILALTQGCAKVGAPPPVASGVTARTHAIQQLEHARALWRQGDLPRARAALRRVLTKAKQSGWPGLAADASFLLGAVAEGEGDSHLAAKEYARAFDWSRRAGDRARGVRALNALANALLDLGDYDGTLEASTAAENLARAMGDLEAQSVALHNAAEAHRFSGRFRMAMDTYRASLRLARRLGNSRDLTAILTNMGHTARQHSRLDEAAGYYAEALALARRSDDPRSAAPLLNYLSAIRLAQHNMEEASTLARQASETSQKANLPRALATATQNQGLAAWGMGRPKEARDLLARAARLSAELDDTYTHAYILWNLGRLHQETGDRGAATETLRQAHSLLIQLGRPEEAERVGSDLGALR